MRPLRALGRRAGIAVVVFTVAAVPVAGGDVSNAEVDGFRLVARLPDVLALPIRAVMPLGTLPAVGIVAGVLFAFAPGRRWQAAGAVIVAGIAARFASDGLKDVFDRSRPLVSVTDVVPRDSAEGLGFPSTHAAVAFALAGVVVWWLPRRWQPAAWALAAMVAIARVYVGVHYPLDVVGGAAVGVVMASVAVALFGAPRRDFHPASSRSTGTARP